MFTGIIVETGEVEHARDRGGAVELRLRVAALWERTAVGDSVSVSGVCLTVKEKGPGFLLFDAVRTTCERTTLKALRPGARVNLEPALRLGDPLGGHLVSGHVDGIGTVRELRPRAGETRLVVEAPEAVLPFLAERGSVAVDGVSLTVAALRGPRFEAAVIPHTLRVTTLGDLRPGDGVNLEADLLARYVARLLEAGRVPGGGGITLEKLREQGF